MAELLSVQVHVPLTKADDGQLMERKLISAGGKLTCLKKIDNITQQDCSGGARFDYLPKRKAVDLEFKGLTYSVSEGRKKGLK